MKHLILNADDFGYSKIFNVKILELLDKGLITSTTAMMNYLDNDKKDQLKELIDLAKRDSIGVGLHVEFRDTDFDYQLKSQYDTFISKFGFKPTHMDIHKYAYLNESLESIEKFCSKNDLPARNHGLEMNGVIMTKDKFFDGTFTEFYELEDWLETLEDEIVYEVMVHPGLYDPDSTSTLNKKREDDIKKIIKLNKLLPKYDIDLVNYSYLV
ncbi:MAG: ChbG/HpnK family deacetylase [Nanoarchaeota archaeon]|nr:ChbG/HpnK family deacetylase [Nanoarchaeota archaeon]MCG2718139.1 ChbG/HpnK family deacetylase [Nanoarchaeota archaeon]